MNHLWDFFLGDVVFSKNHNGYNELMSKKTPQGDIIPLYHAGDLAVVRSQVYAIPNKFNPEKVETLWEGNMPVVESGSIGIVLENTGNGAEDDLPWVLLLIEEQELLIPQHAVKIIQQSRIGKNNTKRPKNG